MTERTGSCLCGSIKIKITGPHFRTNLCHCTSCQKSTGVVCASNAFYKTDQVEYTLSDPSVMKTYVDKSPDSGSVLERFFCGNCGAKVKGANQGHPGMIGVPMGIIDGDLSDLKPEMEFFTCHRMSWLSGVDGAASFEKMPPMPPS